MPLPPDEKFGPLRVRSNENPQLVIQQKYIIIPQNYLLHNFQEYDKNCRCHQTKSLSDELPAFIIIVLLQKN